jgi:uncharacterized protein
MKLSGTETLPAARENVWMALNDPDVLKQCIPGCSEIVQKSPTEMTAKVTMKLGPMKINFTGAVTLSDLQPPEGYRISGSGSGGLLGGASGGANVKLTALSATETQLDYDVDAQVTGKIASLGARLIDSTAQSLAGQFFTKFASVVKKDYGAAAPAASKPAAKKASAKKSVAKKAAPKKSAAKKTSKKKK